MYLIRGWKIRSRNRPLRVDATHGEAAKPSEASAEESGVSELELESGGIGVRSQELVSWSLELELESGGIDFSWS